MKTALSIAAFLATAAMPALAQDTAAPEAPAAEAAAEAPAAEAAAPEAAGAAVWNLDPGHSQIVFHYDHLGFSTTTGMFGGINGTINLDEAAPENSSVEVSFPVRSMLTGWEERFGHFMSPDFFDAADGSEEMVTFTSTKVEPTSDTKANVTGDLTLNGVTKEVVLEVELNQIGNHPQSGKPAAGFDAETTIKRSDFELGMFAPAVADEVEIDISVEAAKAE